MMIRIHTYVVTTLMISVCALLAQSPAGENADSTDTDTQEKGPEAELRDPFWPVGWTPPPPREKLPDGPPVEAPPEFTPKWSTVLRSIEVKSIVETFNKGEYIATVSGFGVVEKGDILPIKHDGYIYKVLIRDITNKGLRPEKQSVTPQK